MENSPAQPNVFLTPEAQNHKPPKSWKPLIFVALGIFIIVLSLGGYYYRSKLGINKLFALLNTKTKTQPVIAGKGKVADLATKDLASLFYADLEYNPKTGVVTQLKAGLIKSGQEQSPLSANLPKDLASSNFAYKVEVLSPDSKTILESGWKITFKKVIETPKGTYRFGVVTAYKPNSIIKIYLPGNKLIWTGKVQVESS